MMIKKIVDRIIEGLVILCLVPMWFLLMIANWIGHEIFGEYEDWEDREW